MTSTYIYWFSLICLYLTYFNHICLHHESDDKTGLQEKLFSRKMFHTYIHSDFNNVILYYDILFYIINMICYCDFNNMQKHNYIKIWNICIYENIIEIIKQNFSKSNVGFA